MNEGPDLNVHSRSQQPQPGGVARVGWIPCGPTLRREPDENVVAGSVPFAVEVQLDLPGLGRDDSAVEETLGLVI